MCDTIRSGLQKELLAEEVAGRKEASKVVAVKTAMEAEDWCGDLVQEMHR